MGNSLLAVLVPATATIENIDRLLAQPMRRLLREHSIDGYRLGGQLTGAWSPDYDPQADPVNWQQCPGCGGTGQRADQPCRACADPGNTGRPPGTSVKFYTRWAPHPGDIVPLPTLLDPAWRFPPQRTPEAWVDLAGTVWVDTSLVKYQVDAGPAPVPPRLREVFDQLRNGRRSPWGPRRRAEGRRVEVFDPAAWSVAVVAAHH